MNKKLLVSSLVFVLALVVLVSSFTVAFTKRKSGNEVLYSRQGYVTLQLPQGDPAHPTDIRLGAYDGLSKSFNGKEDFLVVALWAPPANTYVPVALITDNQGGFDSVTKYYAGLPIPLVDNIVKVGDKDIEVWKSGDVLKAELSIPVEITAFGETFTLPPLTMVFRGFDSTYKEKTDVATYPSGWSGYEKVWKKPAWVQVNIPAWLGTVPAVETVGFFNVNAIHTMMPPA